MPTIIRLNLQYRLKKNKIYDRVVQKLPNLQFNVSLWLGRGRERQQVNQACRHKHTCPPLPHCSWVTSLSANSLSPCVYSSFNEPALSLVKTIIEVKLRGRLRNRFLRNIILVLQALSSFLIIWKMAAFPWKATLNPLGL